MLNPQLRALIESGPLAHLATIGKDGSPQVSAIWIGLHGDQIVSAHLNRSVKVRNVERDSRVVLSFDAPRTPGVFLAEHAILRATVTIEQTTAASALLHRLGHVYVGPEFTFPAPEGTPGFLLRYDVTKVGGVGPWAAL